jgi:SAM-dependent methyltransferase
VRPKRRPVAAGTCCCCGSNELELRFEVAGAVGEAGLIPTTDEFGKALADIVRCRRCGHMQLERMPSPKLLASLYEQAESTDYVEEEAGQRETARRILERIEAQAKPGAILDVGCWVGYLLAEAEGRGWRGTGLEPSAWAASFARQRLGLDVRNEGLDKTDLGEERYGAIFMGDVIEHLVDPGATLERLRGHVAAGGVLAMALPDAGSRLARAMGRRWWAIAPTHVQYFTRASMSALLERTGYRVLEMDTQPKAFTAAYYLGRTGGYSPRLARGLVRAARAVQVADRMVAPDFGDRMLVIARAVTG